MIIKNRLLSFFEIPQDRQTPDRYGYLYSFGMLAVVLVTIGNAWTLGGRPTIAYRLPLFGNLLDLTPLFRCSGAGVDLLFVLAGMILVRPWLVSAPLRPGLRPFYLGWFWRGGPTYYLALAGLLLFFAPGYITQEAVFSRDGAVRVGAHLLFAQYLLPLSQASWTVNSSLSIITLLALFVFITPWLARLFEGRRWLISLPVTLVVGLGWLWLSRESFGPVVSFFQSTVSIKEMDTVALRNWLSHQLPTYLFNFGLGLTLAVWLARRELTVDRLSGRWWRRLNSTEAGWVWIGLGLVLLLYGLNKTNTDPSLLFSYYLSHITLAVGWAVLLAGVSLVGPLRRVLNWWLVRLVGQLAYSFYLWQLPMLYLFQSYQDVGNMIPPQRFRQLLLYEFTFGLALAVVFYLTCHRPFLERAARYNLARSAATQHPLEENREVGAKV